MIGAALLYCSIRLAREIRQVRSSKVTLPTTISTGVSGWTDIFSWTVIVYAPKQMLVSDSYHISVTMEASENPSIESEIARGRFPPVAIESNQGRVVLRGVAFDLDPNEGFLVDATSATISKMWSVRPKSTGRQELVLDFSGFPLVGAYLRRDHYHVEEDFSAFPSRRRSDEQLTLDHSLSSIIIPVTVSNIWGFSPTQASLLQKTTGVFAFLLMCPAIIGGAKWMFGKLKKKENARIIKP